MRILVLGGTAWLGGHVAADAVRRGHDVVCLARGTAGEVPLGGRLVRADRDHDDAYDGVVAGDPWDTVVDVSRQPGQVRRAAAALAGRAEHYVFVSSGSVYADHATPSADESAEVLPALDGDVMESMETYGEAKVACERHVLASLGPERAAIVRAGLIGGPGDASGRTGYWPLRFARPADPDARVLVPRDDDLPTQVIDVRDLAAWIVALSERRTPGTFNAVGETVRFRDHIDAARAVAAHDGSVAWAPSDWLLEQGVAPWMGERSLPIWLPMADYAGFCARSGAAARAAGLVTRPLRETLADTLAWELEEGADRARGSGLTPDEERELLARLDASAH